MIFLKALEGSVNADKIHGFKILHAACYEDDQKVCVSVVAYTAAGLCWTLEEFPYTRYQLDSITKAEAEARALLDDISAKLSD